MPSSPRVLVIDLNNFSRYPTISVGYLVAALRQAGLSVDVLTPLAHGISGVARELAPWGLSRLSQEIRVRTATSRSQALRAARRLIARGRMPGRRGERRTIVNAVRSSLRHDVVLVSSYLMYREVVKDLGQLCLERQVPMLVGGPYFSQPSVVSQWVGIPGVSAIVGGEAELTIAAMVRDLCAGLPIEGHPGVASRDRPHAAAAPPLMSLDEAPIPDYCDFPWDLYAHRIVPLLSGRGCSWGACQFCSDVTSSMGRRFRSRNPELVLAEMELQAVRYRSRNFVFTDLKLNSDGAMWHTLLESTQRAVPGASWIGAVHIETSGESGLSRSELEAARAAGMVRLTTGLESGSQRMLDLMKKGTSVETNSRVIRDAAAAGISVRTTLVLGYPGEQASDVLDTVEFLREHEESIGRVALNRLAVMVGTPLHRALELGRLGRSVSLEQDLPSDGLVEHDYPDMRDGEYRRAVRQMLAVIDRINRKTLSAGIDAFVGVM